MSAGAVHSHFEQPATFAFTPDSMKKVDEVIAKYPKGRQASAVMALLWIAQQQHDNWIPEAAMEEMSGFRHRDHRRRRAFRGDGQRAGCLGLEELRRDCLRDRLRQNRWDACPRRPGRVLLFPGGIDRRALRGGRILDIFHG